MSWWQAGLLYAGLWLAMGGLLSLQLGRHARWDGHRYGTVDPEDILPR